jgi:hypothetical protein
MRVSGVEPRVFVGDTGGAASTRPSYVPFCPPGSCLYYAGDYDSSNSNADSLYNANDTGDGLEAQVWVGVRPDRDVTVTGATFVEMLAGDYVATNPTPFSVQVGIKPGQVGTTVCNTSGNATFAIYGGNQPSTYNYTIKKLAKPCKLKKGEVYYVNLLPTAADGYGFLVNAADKKPPNHYGWKNDLNDCYINGSGFGLDYAPCDTQGPFPALSIALTGR